LAAERRVASVGREARCLQLRWDATECWWGAACGALGRPLGGGAGRVLRQLLSTRSRKAAGVPHALLRVVHGGRRVWQLLSSCAAGGAPGAAAAVGHWSGPGGESSVLLLVLPGMVGRLLCAWLCRKASPCSSESQGAALRGVAGNRTALLGVTKRGCTCMAGRQPSLARPPRLPGASRGHAGGSWCWRCS
jgi:hypothetical protein